VCPPERALSVRDFDSRTLGGSLWIEVAPIYLVACGWSEFAVLELSDELIFDTDAPSVGHSEIGDCIVPGLRLRIKSTGIKTFLVRKRIGSRVQAVQIGDFDPLRFNLRDARTKAQAVIELLGDENRQAPPQANQKTDTIRRMFDRYLVAKSQLRTVRETERIFKRHILPVFGDRRPETVTRSEVTLLIDGINTPSMARAVAAQFSSFFTWLQPRCDSLATNPCAHAGKPPAIPSRERVLTNAELRALWKIVSRDAGQFSRGVQMLLLTLQRRSEVFGADCSEFDLASSCWTIPAARTKNRRAQEIPLSAEALRVVARQIGERTAGKLFPAKGKPEHSLTGFAKCWTPIRRSVDRELGITAERFTLHDLRRTGATCMQRLGIKIEVTEAVLNHVSGSRSGIVGVYQRYAYRDEKRQALEAWAAELRKIVKAS
jgi:integrase